VHPGAEARAGTQPGERTHDGVVADLGLFRDAGEAQVDAVTQRRVGEVAGAVVRAALPMRVRPRSVTFGPITVSLPISTSPPT
jgi:hypothetical protein